MLVHPNLIEQALESTGNFMAAAAYQDNPVESLLPSYELLQTPNPISDSLNCDISTHRSLLF